MNRKNIEKLIQLMKLKGIYHVKLGNENREIEIIRDLADSDKIEINDSSDENPLDDIYDKNSLIIRSEYVGIFIESDQQYKKGDLIKKGEILGYIESGNIKHPIKVEQDYIIDEIFVEHNEIIEYGQDLFKLKEPDN